MLSSHVFSRIGDRLLRWYSYSFSSSSVRLRREPCLSDLLVLWCDLCLDLSESLFFDALSIVASSTALSESGFLSSNLGLVRVWLVSTRSVVWCSSRCVWTKLFKALTSSSIRLMRRLLLLVLDNDRDFREAVSAAGIRLL